MPLADSELARREGGRIELRRAPMRLRWAMEKLVSGDGHELRAVFTCSVQVLAEAAEQQMLAEVFLNNSSSVWAEAVVAHFQPALRAAIAQICGVRRSGWHFRAGWKSCRRSSWTCRAHLSNSSGWKICSARWPSSARRDRWNIFSGRRIC